MPASDIRILDSLELAAIHRRLHQTHPNYPRFNLDLWECLRALSGHLLADAREAEDLLEGLKNAEITAVALDRELDALDAAVRADPENNHGGW